jgi:pheromone alpha factor receptor
MASSNSTDDFDVLTQIFTLIGSDGVTEIPVAVNAVDAEYTARFAVQANYGSQIGATIIMLIVYLVMTPRVKFRRVPTMINTLSLLCNIVRCVLLSWFPSSQWYEFYTLWSGDTSLVPAVDYRTSVAGTVFTIPVIILIEAALIVQAWAMIQMWPAAYKFPTVVVSALVAGAAVAFKFADSILQALTITSENVPQVLWVRKTDLAFSSASIFWFCFLFNVRLAIHLFQNRRILPSVKGMTAMEVLVMTNGILMCVPGKCSFTTSTSMCA